MRNRARATKASLYASLLKDRGIPNAKTWLVTNADAVVFERKVGVKPVRVKMGANWFYYMTYAEAALDLSTNESPN